MKYIKEKIQSFSQWFKICFCVLFVVYIAFWFFSISLSSVQKSENITPLLPVTYQDSHEYADLAQSIIHTGTFFQNGMSETFRAPGYPFFVAIFSFIGGYFLVTFIQILLVFLSSLLIRDIGITFCNKKVGELAAFIFLLSPVVLVLSLLVLTDILFLFLFLLGFYLAISLKKERLLGTVILASVIFGVAMYVRPIGVFALPVFILPFLVSKISWREKIISIGAMLLIVGAILLPWVLRNYKLTGVASFSSEKSMNLAFYYVPMFLSNKNGTTVDAEQARIAIATGVPEENWRDLRYAPALDAYTEKIIFDQPFAYATYHITASLPFLFSSSIEEAIYEYRSALHLPVVSSESVMSDFLSGHVELFLQGISAVWWKLLERIIFVLMYLVALFGLWSERKKLFAWVLVCIPLYLMLLAGPVANARLAVQGLPFILLLFSIGFWKLYSKLNHAKS